MHQSGHKYFFEILNKRIDALCEARLTQLAGIAAHSDILGTISDQEIAEELVKEAKSVFLA